MSLGSACNGQAMSFHSTAGEKRAISSSTWAVAYSRYSALGGMRATIAGKLSIGGGTNVQSMPPL
jgi:hypothetical protein